MSDRRYWWAVPSTLTAGRPHAVQRWNKERTAYEAACSLTITPPVDATMVQDVPENACKNCRKATQEGTVDYVSKPPAAL